MDGESRSYRNGEWMDLRGSHRRLLVRGECEVGEECTGRRCSDSDAGRKGSKPDGTQCKYCEKRKGVKMASELGRRMRKRAASFATKDLGESLKHWPAMIRLYTLNFRRVDAPDSGFDGEMGDNGEGVLSSTKTRRALAGLPALVLMRVALYLDLSDIAVLLQLPSRRIRFAALLVISNQLHEVRDLASLHYLLSYGGMVSYFYRSSALLLFGRHFTKILPEAWNAMGPLYACFLGLFMVFLYAFPFFGMFIAFLVIDAATSARVIIRRAYLHLEELLLSRFWYASHGWSSTIEESNLTTKARILYLYTHAVRRLQFLGTTQPSSKGLMNPWSSYLYLVSSCYPNITYLRIVRCSLAWWFRIDSLAGLSELVLEECEIDENGMEIFAINCPHVRVMRFLSTNVRISVGSIPRLKSLRCLFNGDYRSDESPLSEKNPTIVNTLFADLEEICFKSCHCDVDASTIYFFLLYCPKIQVVRFYDSKPLKDTFFPDFARLQIINNERWYVMASYRLDCIKKFWSIP